MNSMNIDMARVQLSAIDHANRSDSPVPRDSRAPLPPLPAIPPGSDVAPPLETIQSVQSTESIMMDALTSSDPSVLLSAMAMTLRKSSVGAAEAGLRANRAGEREH